MPNKGSARTRPDYLLSILWLIATFLVLARGTYLALFIAPVEETMGNIYRIFYYHVPINISALIFPYVNLGASLYYLYFRRRNTDSAHRADAVALAAAEVTILYTSLGLITGMLWARPVWGIWWTWDARLTTFLLLWLLYVCYLVVRRLSSTGQARTLAAVLSIFAAIDVPIVYMSIQWWRTQHPSPVLTGDGQLDPSMWPPLLWNFAGWFMWGVFLIYCRFIVERNRQAAEQKLVLESIEAAAD